MGAHPSMLCTDGMPAAATRSHGRFPPTRPWYLDIDGGSERWSDRSSTSGGRRSSAYQSPRSAAADGGRSLEEIYEQTAQLGLESPKVIFGIDFTKSNEWTGKLSFNRQNLHHLGRCKNPYEQVISAVGRSLPGSDEKNPILCYGFGDESTADQKVFGFHGDVGAFRDADEALSHYREIVPRINLAGPTSFAPIIQMAISKVMESGRDYHALFIIADGKISRSANLSPRVLSSQEEDTINALVRARKYPLSVFLVGVGDGPWDSRTLDFVKRTADNGFDNFKFINFTKIMSRRDPPIVKEKDFDLIVWRTIYKHYKKILELGLLWDEPARKIRADLVLHEIPSLPSDDQPHLHENHSPPVSDQICTICYCCLKDMAFGCGHRTCCECGMKMEACPICRTHIQTRIKLHL